MNHKACLIEIHTTNVIIFIMTYFEPLIVAYNFLKALGILLFLAMFDYYFFSILVIFSFIEQSTFEMNVVA